MRCGLTDEIEIGQERGSALVQSFPRGSLGTNGAKEDQYKYIQKSSLRRHDRKRRDQAEAELNILLSNETSKT